MRSVFLLIFLFHVLLPADVQSQTVVRGVVRDAVDGQVLPAANVQVEGTLRGTITNEDGVFEVRLETVPAILVVRYIGYETASVPVPGATDRHLDIRLQPVTYALGEIVVTGEDPAVNIMRKVLESKQRWWHSLSTFKAKAYTRLRVANDTSIVLIEEAASDLFWDRERGPREVVTSRRRTENWTLDASFAQAHNIQNFYADDIQLFGFDMIGPTHPDALRHYFFTLTDYHYLDDQVVYEIGIEPRSRLQPAFVGSILVLDEAYAILEMDLTPNEAVLLPPPFLSFEAVFRQQFNHFGTDYWLPVDARIESRFKIGVPGLVFPEFVLGQLSSISDYAVNEPLPDSLYAEERITSVDTVAVRKDSLFTNVSESIPLSEEEETAYAHLDSTDTIERAFKPSGVLARFVELEVQENGGTTDGSTGGALRDIIRPRPDVWYNRVDGLYLGMNVRAGIHRRVSVSGGSGYGLGPGRWSYRIGTDATLGRRERWTFHARYFSSTDSYPRSIHYTRFINSFMVLFDGTDYFDYYRNEGINASLSVRIPDLDTRIIFGVGDERHSSINKTTDYHFRRSDRALDVNDPIDEGHLQAGRLRLLWGDAEIIPGIVGQRRIDFTVEFSDPRLFHTDFDYARYNLQIDWVSYTFLRRRLLPNALYMRLTAGTFTGSLPVQRFGMVDAVYAIYTPFGVLKTLNRRPYLGEQYVSFFWEHNFRTVPFEILGLRGLARRGFSILLFGGHGRTWVSKKRQQSLSSHVRFPDRFHHELGISLSGLFGLFRIDVATRLDRPGFSVGIGAARLF